MSKREVRLYVEDIQTAIQRIEEYTAHTTFQEFVEDIKTVDAVVRNFSVIGEAVKNIPEEIKSQHQNIPWEEIIGMRNKIIHEYFGVDEEILWKTIKNDLPVFKELISELSAKF